VKRCEKGGVDQERWDIKVNRGNWELGERGGGIQCKLWAEGRYSLINIRGNTSRLGHTRKLIGVTPASQGIWGTFKGNMSLLKDTYVKLRDTTSLLRNTRKLLGVTPVSLGIQGNSFKGYTSLLRNTRKLLGVKLVYLEVRRNS
jgi:hypothetical protein